MSRSRAPSLVAWPVLLAALVALPAGAWAANAEVRFESSPPGATVLIDGRSRCLTPCTLALAAGRRSVAMHLRGHARRTAPVVATAGAVVRWDLQRSGATVAIETLPAGAQITVDGIDRGQSPAGLDLRPGDHTLELGGRCFEPLKRPLSLARGETQHVRERLVARTRTANVDATDAEGAAVVAEVLVEGTVLGQTPVKLEVPRCTRTISVRHAALGEVSWELEADDGELKLSAKLSGGAVQRAPGSLVAPTRGATRPTVTIVAFTDYQCPFCKRVEDTVDRVLRQYPDDVRLELHHLPLSFHKRARPAAIAAMAAQLQGRFWEMHEALFTNQKRLDDEHLRGLAGRLGLDIERWQRDVSGDEVKAYVAADSARAAAVGARGTPTFYINGHKLAGAQPERSFAALIDAEIAAARARGARGRDWVRSRTVKNNPALAANLYDAQVAGARVAVAVPTLKVAQAPTAEVVYRVPVGRGDPQVGPKDALVTLVHFADFQCPFCRRAARTLSQLRKRYPRELRLVYRHLPLPFHRQAGIAAEASLCAHAQGRFWKMHDKLMAASTNKLMRADLDRYAGEVGLKMAGFRKCMDKGNQRPKVEADKALAARLSLRGTPQALVNGRRIAGAVPLERYAKVVEAELARAKALVKSGVPRRAVYDHIMKQASDDGSPLASERQEIDLAGAPRLGPKNAGHTVVVFGSLRDGATRTLLRLAKTQAQKKAKVGVGVAFKHLVRGSDGRRLANAHACAAEQDRFWRFHDTVDAQLTAGEPPRLLKAAAEAGLDTLGFEACLHGGVYDERVAAESAEARKLGAERGPAVFVDGRRLVPPGGQSMTLALERLLPVLSVKR